jgi:hypothetical protein
MFEGTTKNAHLQKFCAKVHFKCKINANGLHNATVLSRWGPHFFAGGVLEDTTGRFMRGRSPQRFSHRLIAQQPTTKMIITHKTTVHHR